MKNIEILEINEIGDYEEGLSLLLEVMCAEKTGGFNLVN